MTVLTFPTLTRGPSAIAWRLRGLTQSHTSPFDGTTQTLAQPGARWVATITWPSLVDADRRVMDAFLAKLGGRAGRFTFGPSIHAPRRATGIAGRTNHVWNSLFNGAGIGVTPTYWQLSNGGGVTVAITGVGSDGTGSYIDIGFSGTPASTYVGALRILPATAATAGVGQVWTGAATMQTQGTVTNIALIRPFVADVTGGGAYAGSETFGTGTVAPLTAVTRREVSHTLVDVGAGMGVDVRATSSGVAIALTLRVWTPQLERRSAATAFISTSTGPVTVSEGPYINGASQAGSTLNVDGWLAAADAMKAGDFLSYLDTTGRQRLHMVTADAVATEVGGTALAIAPPIRRAGADNAVVEIASPLAVFMLAEDEVGLATRPPLIGSVTLEIMEALA